MPPEKKTYTYPDLYRNNVENTYKYEIKEGVKKMADKLVAGVATGAGKKTMTFRDLVGMSVYLKVEVGAFVSGAGNLCFSRGREGAIVIPADCTIIAHTHPTTSTAPDQVTGDMRRCNDQVELAVTAAGLIIYYSEGYCYNSKVGDALTSKIEYRNAFAPGHVDLDRVITADLLTHLGKYA